MPPKKKSYAAVNKIRTNSKKKRSNQNIANQVEDYLSNYYDHNGHLPDEGDQLYSQLQQTAEGLYRGADSVDRTLYNASNQIAREQNPSSHLDDVNDILNRANWTQSQSSNQREPSPPSPPPPHSRSPSPDPKRRRTESEDSNSESESESEDEPSADSPDLPVAGAVAEDDLPWPDPYIVTAPMTDLDSQHVSINLTTISPVWNDPHIQFGSGGVTPGKHTDISSSFKWGWAEIDSYIFWPKSLLSNSYITDNGTRSRFIALMNLYQEFKFVSCTASYYPNNKNTVTAPGLVDCGLAPDVNWYPSIEGVVYQPYNMCCRFDRNDAYGFVEPATTTATNEIFERINVMESMNGTKCFKSDQPTTFTITPETLAGIIDDQSTVYSSPPIGKGTVPARPIAAPWIPTKVQSGSTIDLNLGTQYYSFKVGMYNMQFPTNITKWGQVLASSGFASSKQLNWAVQLGTWKFSWRFEFRIREERPWTGSIAPGDALLAAATDIGPHFIERVRQTVPTIDEEKGDVESPSKKPRLDDLSIGGLQQMLS